MHRSRGLETAANLSQVLTEAAVRGECGGLGQAGDLRYLALVPFYGGLPPNVTGGRVDSSGEGNSLLDRDTKVRQLAATLCSALRHFGQVPMHKSLDN